jgi:hypothetical protein
MHGLVLATGGGGLAWLLNLAICHPPPLLGLLTPPPDPLSLHLFPFAQVIGRRCKDIYSLKVDVGMRWHSKREDCWPSDSLHR